MSDDLSRKRLGRGLAALIGEIDRPLEPATQATRADGRIPIAFIAPNPRNPRRRKPRRRKPRRCCDACR